MLHGVEREFRSTDQFGFLFLRGLEGGSGVNKRNRSMLTLAAFLVAMTVGIGTAIAVTLFYHHMPGVSVSATITRNCDPTIADPPGVTVGTNGQETFWCGPTSSAITMTGPLTATPTFTDTFRAPYVSLWLYKADGNVITGNCSVRTGALQLQNNTAMALPAGNFNYCAEYFDVPDSGLKSFIVKWDA